ncbi:MAG: hypothetical protein H7145_13975 [Akkermansiaceae bacterium]|nr:hypothetical protein [Armatimonadota bacterium]
MTRAELHNLIAQVEARSTNFVSTYHGPQHWRCVSLIGIQIARETTGGDPLVAFLFGLFHDAMRENEDDDPRHGARGAALLRELAAQGPVPLSLQQRYYVLHACETHTSAPPTTVVPVGVCYDADRLTLWRVGITPDETYLSTQVGKELARSHSTRERHEKLLTWTDVLDVLFSRQDRNK